MIAQAFKKETLMKGKVLKILGGCVVIAGLVAIALPSILHKAGLHPEYQGEITQVPAGKRALIIATNQAVLSAPGETTGAATGVMARNDSSVLQFYGCGNTG